jgi:hypothetical protein
VTYTYEDIRKFRLTDECSCEFVKRLGDLVGIRYAAEYILQNIDHLLAQAETNSYRNKLQYLLASDARERAMSAFSGPSATFKQDVLDIWLSVTARMTDFEKVMLGWDKV